MNLFFNILVSTLATLISTLIISILFHFLGLISHFYRIINFLKSNKKIVFVFEKHRNIVLKWRNYWKIFKDDGYKIVRIKDQNQEIWKKINSYLKKANDVSIAGYAKIEYAIYIGLMSSKKETTVFYRTQNSQIERMVFNNDKFKIKKQNEAIFKQKDLTILQNKKSSSQFDLQKAINLTTENEHPSSLEYIFEVRKIASLIANLNKNSRIEINFIGKTIFAFVLAQALSYDVHQIIVKVLDKENKWKKINLNEKLVS